MLPRVHINRSHSRVWRLEDGEAIDREKAGIWWCASLTLRIASRLSTGHVRDAGAFRTRLTGDDWSRQDKRVRVGRDIEDSRLGIESRAAPIYSAPRTGE